MHEVRHARIVGAEVEVIPIDVRAWILEHPKWIEAVVHGDIRLAVCRDEDLLVGVAWFLRNDSQGDLGKIPLDVREEKAVQAVALTRFEGLHKGQRRRGAGRGVDRCSGSVAGAGVLALAARGRCRAAGCDAAPTWLGARRQREERAATDRDESEQASPRPPLRVRHVELPFLRRGRSGLPATPAAAWPK